MPPMGQANAARAMRYLAEFGILPAAVVDIPNGKKNSAQAHDALRPRH